jgi:hypothetical protein
MRLDEVRKGIAALQAERGDDWLRFRGHQVPARRRCRGWAHERALPPRAWRAERPSLPRRAPPAAGGEAEYVDGLKAVAEAGPSGSNPCGG